MAFRLPRLPFNWKNQPQLFERYWDETLVQLEKTLNAILDIPLIESAVADAQAAAGAAQAAADTAQSASGANTEEMSLVNSFCEGFIGPLISGTSAGVVTIANHTRAYGDSTLNPSVAVVGGSVATGAAPGDVVRIYYLDATRTGGSVSYLFTIDNVDPPPVQGNNAHSVGAVQIPASGSNDGKGVRPPGYVEV